MYYNVYIIRVVGALSECLVVANLHESVYIPYNRIFALSQFISLHLVRETNLTRSEFFKRRTYVVYTA